VSSETSAWELFEDMVNFLRIYARLLKAVADIEERTDRSFLVIC